MGRQPRLAAVLLFLACAAGGWATQNLDSVEEKCSGDCVKSWRKCGGSGMNGFRPCCSDKDQCVKANKWYSQCRPKTARLPRGWLGATVVKCTDEAPAGCGKLYKSGIKSSCGSKCNLPGKTVPASSQGDCLAQCDRTADCNCALFDAGAKQCAMQWTPCNSAVLGLSSSGSGPAVAALQPCRESPLPIDRSKFPMPAGRNFGNCKPYTLFPGIMVVDLKPRRTIEVASAADCARTCAHNFLKKGSSLSFADAEAALCNSFTYYPAAVAPGSRGLCELYADRFDKTSPQNYVEVLAADGLGIVSGSYCTPLYVADDDRRADVSGLYPLNPIADTGVDWSAACPDASSEFGHVPNQIPKCGPQCALFPKRADLDLDPDGLFYTVSSEARCKQDCAADRQCACAYYRAGVACHLSTAPCSDPVYGATYDPNHVRSAFPKCPGSGPKPPGVPKQANKSWLGDWSLDWYGIWDAVCESDEPSYTYGNEDSGTLIGPKGLVSGVHPTQEASNEACVQRCEDLDECSWAVFEPQGKRCTLMQQTAPRIYVPSADVCAQDGSGCPPGAKPNVMTLLCENYYGMSSSLGEE